MIFLDPNEISFPDPEFTHSESGLLAIGGDLSLQRLLFAYQLISSYTKLHKRGFAKSVEVWQDKELVGGFYGVQIGNVFCGESMFSKVSNASKAGFIHFVLKHQENIELIDCQIHSDHLESLGARMITKKEYLKILKKNNES